MAEGRLAFEPEVQLLFKHIDHGENILLSGGAGSGKTYSLVETIRGVLQEYPLARIACITYTNSAVREITDRVQSNRLQVSTIHDFLWDNIKAFQRELKRSLIALLNAPEGEGINSPDGTVSADYFDQKDIQYKEYTRVREGVISHDEVLILANHMFTTYSKLCDILKDKFHFILVDEYQDTNPLVVQILLDHLKSSKKHNIVGFFGDAMQSIYDDGVGDLNKYIESNAVKEVKKEQNRRNPRLVFELANKLRTDGISQKESADSSAPNMESGRVKEGSVKFFYSNGDNPKLDDVKASLGWDFSDTQEVKELNLTHNLIAQKAGFGKLMGIYDGDKILDYKKRITDYIKTHIITDDFTECTFGQVIEKLLEGKTPAEKKAILPTPGMTTFIEEHSDLYEQAKNYPFEAFKSIYVDKDGLVDDKKQDEDDASKPGSKRDALIKHLFKIQTNIHLYKENNINEFLRKTEFKIQKADDKKRLKEIIERLEDMHAETIEAVIDYADANGICKKDDKLAAFTHKQQYVFERVKSVEFQEFQNLFDYLEGSTPFSTQHKIKGREFKNVLVVLDNGNWSKYNFKYLFEQNGTESVRTRTNKLFYVCCTRAKENLAVYYHAPTTAALAQAKIWFGEENVVEF